jgi:hypothetical protein
MLCVTPEVRDLRARADHAAAGLDDDFMGTETVGTQLVVGQLHPTGLDDLDVQRLQHDRSFRLRAISDEVAAPS